MGSEVANEGCTNVNNVKSFLDRALNVEGETGVDFRGNLAGDNCKDLLPKFDKQAVQGRVDLLVNVFALHL